MARKDNPETTLTMKACEVRQHDLIVGKDGADWFVDSRSRRIAVRGNATLHVIGADRRMTVVKPDDDMLTVRAEHACHCSGTGRFRGGGVIENGVYKGYEGECYGCSGKGWQDRGDVLRNRVYWNHYARIGN